MKTMNFGWQVQAVGPIFMRVALMHKRRWRGKNLYIDALALVRNCKPMCALTPMRRKNIDSCPALPQKICMSGLKWRARQEWKNGKGGEQIQYQKRMEKCEIGANGG